MTQGSDSLHFFYDAQNRPAIVEWNNGVTTAKYAYIQNLQGDIIGIVDSNGTEVVKYTYDAWGKVLSTTGSLASTLGNIQPFRYRGYVYDVETGLYYLRSRYYNPTWGRFLNADGLIGKRLFGANVYCYCACNPVNRTDNSGRDWFNDVKEWFEQAWSDVGNAVSDAWNDASSWCSQAWNDASSWCSHACNNVEQFFVDLGDSIQDMWKEFFRINLNVSIIQINATQNFLVNLTHAYSDFKTKYDLSKDFINAIASLLPGVKPFISFAKSYLGKKAPVATELAGHIGNSAAYYISIFAWNILVYLYSDEETVDIYRGVYP